MIKVGLTGGIGSGKTHIAEYFKKLGVPVYNSDARGKYLMDNDVSVIKKLITSFGKQTYLNKKLNRTYIAKIVFNDKEKLTAINNIVHPAVQSDFENWCKTKSKFPYIIKEAAILIESKALKNLDYLIVVRAPKKVRIERVMQRDKLSNTEVENRIANQISDDERIRYANFIIDNDGTMLVEQQVDKIDRKLNKIQIINEFR